MAKFNKEPVDLMAALEESIAVQKVKIERLFAEANNKLDELDKLVNSLEEN